MKKIAFYSPHLSLGGTEITLYDFADYNEKLLHNSSIILYNNNHPLTDSTVVDKFTHRFSNVHCLEGPSYNWAWKKQETVPLLDAVIHQEQCDVLYMQKFGHNDGVVSNLCKTVILCAAPVCEPHGDVYAYVSEWLSQEASSGRYPAVPSMITPLSLDAGDLRGKLGIPDSARVFGRHGGSYGWNLPWGDMVVERALNASSDIYFLFQNTPLTFSHPRLIEVPPSADLTLKAKFINSCDAMIHARVEGETFGCACGEFSTMNKPIITWDGSKDRNHINLLGDKGIYYQSPQTMLSTLLNFKKSSRKDWNCYQQFNPEVVMNTFEKIFLK